MVALIQLILRDPLKGLFVALLFFCLHLWREQGKIRAEAKSVERMLDKKKLDKDDFKMYSEMHTHEHLAIIEHLKTAINLLQRRG